MIEQSVEFEIVADIIEHLNDPLVGLKVGSQIIFTSYSTPAMLIMTAPTLLDACHIGEQFQSLSLLYSYMTLNIEKDWLELRFTLPTARNEVKNFITDRDLMGIYVFFKELLAEPESMVFTCGTARLKPVGAQLKTYLQQVSFQPKFNQPYNWFRIPFAVTRQKVKHANPLIHKVHLIQTYELRRNFFPSNDDTIAQIRQVIAGYDSHFPSLPAIARSLSSSERTLSRKLKDAGISYREIIDAHKKKRALDMLSHKDISISSLSESLGYSESASFLRAFKRWTGLTPKQYLRQNSKRQTD